jgi:hypothetical protein
MNPRAIEIFKFQHIPNLYESPLLKAHAMLVMKQLNRSILDLRGQIYGLEQLGKRHIPRKVGRKYFESIGECLSRVITMSLGENEYDDEADEIFRKVFKIIIEAMLKHNYV